jgi:predicted transcriptional regulator of viral defense system
MDFETLLQLVGAEPVFATGLLLAGDVDPDQVRRQLSRWTSSGRVVQLRRGVYALAEPYRKVAPHPFVVANALVRGSYVSLQSALGYYGMLPEHVARVMSVTTGRSAEYSNALGAFGYRHIKTDWFHGYMRLKVSERQSAFVATPEKALLDLVYLEPGADQPEYLAELRLQSLDRLDVDSLQIMATRSGRPKLERAADALTRMVQADLGEGHLL